MVKIPDLNPDRVPNIIKDFFGAKHLPNTPWNHIYVGPKTETGFDSLPWTTKFKGKKFSEDRFEVFVLIEEILEYVFSVSQRAQTISLAERKEIKEFAHSIGFTIPKPKSAKEIRKRGSENSLEHNKESSIAGPKVYRHFLVFVEDPISVSAYGLEKSPIVLLRGEHYFSEIKSPLPHEAEHNIRWLILKEKLPEIYGKPITTWITFLGL